MKNKPKEVRLRHHLMTRFLVPFVRIFIQRSYKLKIKNYKALKNKGPFVVLANHTVNVDPMVMGLHFPFHLYYIATEQVFNLGFLSKILKFIVNPIKKSKSVSDMETIRKTKRIVQAGGSIGIFPEGNTSYNGETTIIQKSTVKLIRMLKIPVIIINMKGFYLSYPRWSIYRKKGKTASFIKKIMLPDDYLKLTEDALYEILKNELYVNAYDDQEKSGHLYRGKKIAHGLEKLIFIDLKTGEPFVTYSENDKLKSKNSDFSLVYLPTGKVITNEGEETNLIELDHQVKKKYFEFYQATNKVQLFEESVFLNQSFATYKVKLGQYKLILHKDAIELSNHANKYNWHFDDISDIAIQGKFQIIIYRDYDTYIIRLDKYSSPYKYILTHQYYRYIKKGGTLFNDNNNNFGI